MAGNYPYLLGTTANAFKIGLSKLILDVAGLTASRTLTVQDKAGTLAVLSDVSNVVTQTAATRNETITEGGIFILCDCTSNAITVNLPTAVGNKSVISIKKIDSSTNTVTIDPFSTQTVDGSTTALLQVQNVAITLVSDNSNWRVF